MDNFLFIDDSGSKHWEVPYSRDFVDNPPARTDSNRLFWQQNYFVLAGIHVRREVMAVLNPLIDKKKKEVFGTKHVELHSVDLRIKMKQKYLGPYNISKEQLVEFIDGFWYPLFNEYDMQLVAVIVDKRYYKNPRHENKTPLEIAVETLFDRTELHPHRDCQIVFDQMDSQIKSHKRDQGKIFQIADTKIDLQDGKYRNKYSHTSVRFEKSASSNFLQLADMVAYNVWRQFVDFGDEWDNHSMFGKHRVLPTYSYFEKISSNFYHGDNNRVNGYGIVKLPDPFNGSVKGWHIKKPSVDEQ